MISLSLPSSPRVQNSRPSSAVSGVPAPTTRRVVKATPRDGDCSFHALFGEWNDATGRYECRNPQEKRKVVADAIFSNRNSPEIFKLIESGIQSLLMDQVSCENLLKDIKNYYDAYAEDKDRKMQAAWNKFERKMQNYPQIIAYLDRHSTLPNSKLKDKFYACLNKNNRELCGLIFNWADLQADFNLYKEESLREFPLRTYLNDKIIREYVDFIGKPGTWLLPSELYLIACTMNMTVLYYTTDRLTKKITEEGYYNPGSLLEVTIIFDGIGHYERYEKVSAVSQQDLNQNRNSKDSSLLFGATPLPQSSVSSPSPVPSLSSVSSPSPVSSLSSVSSPSVLSRSVSSPNPGTSDSQIGKHYNTIEDLVRDYNRPSLREDEKKHLERLIEKIVSKFKKSTKSDEFIEDFSKLSLLENSVYYSCVINTLADVISQPHVFHNFHALKCLSKSLWQNKFEKLGKEPFDKLVGIVNSKIQQKINSQTEFKIDELNILCEILDDMVAAGLKCSDTNADKLIALLKNHKDMVRNRVNGTTVDKAKGLIEKIKQKLNELRGKNTDIESDTVKEKNNEDIQEQHLLYKSYYIYQASLRIKNKNKSENFKKRALAFFYGCVELQSALSKAGESVPSGGLDALTTAPAVIKSLLISGKYFKAAFNKEPEKPWYDDWSELQHLIFEKITDHKISEIEDINALMNKDFHIYICFGIIDTLSNIIKNHVIFNLSDIFLNKCLEIMFFYQKDLKPYLIQVFSQLRASTASTKTVAEKIDDYIKNLDLNPPEVTRLAEAEKNFLNQAIRKKENQTSLSLIEESQKSTPPSSSSQALMLYPVHTQTSHSNCPERKLRLENDNISKTHADFTGRESELDQLECHLLKDHQGEIKTALLYGPPEMGKSELAIAFGYKHRKAFSFVWTITARTKESMIDSYKDLFYTLTGTSIQVSDDETLILSVHKHLENNPDPNKPFLLIINNLEVYFDFFQKLLRSAQQGFGSILITACQAEFSPLVDLSIGVGHLEKNEALAAFDKIVPHTLISEENKKIREEIIDFLGGHPRAVVLAARNIPSFNIDEKTYFDFLKQSFVDSKNLDPLASAILQSLEPILISVRLTCEKIHGEEQLAFELLNTLAYFNPDFIADAFLDSWLHKKIDDEKKTTRKNVREVLKQYDVIRLRENPSGVAIPRLYQGFLKTQLSPRVRLQGLEAAIDLLISVYKVLDEHNVEDWPLFQNCNLHALSLLEEIEGSPKKAKLYHILGKVAQINGHMKSAKEYFEKSCQIQENLPLPLSKADNLDKAATLTAVAEVTFEYKTAKKFLKEALETYTQIHEKDSQNAHFAYVYLQLGDVFCRHAQYLQAKKFYYLAGEMYDRIPKENSRQSRIASVYSGLGDVCRDQCLDEEAIECYNKALTILYSTYGEGSNHPCIANLHQHLGGIFTQQDRDDEANESYHKALAMYHTIYGKESHHPDIANLHTNLGVLATAKDRNDEANKSYHKALAMYHTAYGEESHHPRIANLHTNLGINRILQDRHKEGRQCYKKALAMYHTAYGKQANHPHFVSLYFKAGDFWARQVQERGFWAKQGHYIKSKQYYTMALAMCDEIYGKDANHVLCAYSHTFLGDVSASNYSYIDALLSYKKALQILQKIYAKNPNILILALVHFKLGGIFHRTSQIEKALFHLQKSLQISCAVKGEDHHAFIIAIKDKIKIIEIEVIDQQNKIKMIDQQKKIKMIIQQNSRCPIL